MTLGQTDALATIETERLLLRRHRVGDFAACHAMWAEPEVWRHIFGRPSTEQEVWMRILRYGGLWPLLGYGYWAIEEKATGLFAGELGFADFKRDIDPVLSGIPELGWALATRFHGRGYGTEAVRAALTWSDAHLAGTRTICLVDPANEKSLGVARKAGYVAFDRVTHNGETSIVLVRERSAS